MNESTVMKKIDEKGIATLTLNRPEVHNAFDDALIAAMTGKFRELNEDPAVRVVVLSSMGKNFSAGADLNWMRRMADYSYRENLDDSMALAELLQLINGMSRPTVARVQGAAFGGGVGLAACCDIVIASERASFSLSEVKLGLVPAVISPYVVEAIGSRAARRYFLTAERFDAEEAVRLGLVHQVVPEKDLDKKVNEICSLLIQNGPLAIKEARKLISTVSRGVIDSEMIAATSESIARIRSSEEGREGVAAFLEKRKPGWVKG